MFKVVGELICEVFSIRNNVGSVFKEQLRAKMLFFTMSEILSLCLKLCCTVFFISLNLKAATTVLGKYFI